MADGSTTALCVRDPGIVPEAQRGSAFRQHCRSAGVLALATTSLGMFMPLLCGGLGFIALGFGWGVAAALAASAAAVSTVNVSALLGNDRLERRLRHRLSADDLEFVGLCRTENNTLRGKYLTPRLDTDDNVGFLEMSDRELRLLTEEDTIAIARDSIRRIDRVTCIELPYLSWIRVEFEDADDILGSFLIMSRQAVTIRRLRKRTETLYAQLVNWHTEGLLKWLDEARGETRES